MALGHHGQKLVGEHRLADKALLGHLRRVREEAKIHETIGHPRLDLGVVAHAELVLDARVPFLELLDNGRQDVGGH